MRDLPEQADIVRKAVNIDRLVRTAIALMEIPSPTCHAAAVADKLASTLREEDFEVERPEADWPEAPAVVALLTTASPGPTLQFAGHAAADVREEHMRLQREVAEKTGTAIDGEYLLCGDGYRIPEADSLVLAVQSSHLAITGRALPPGAKPFADDGNCFMARTGISAISHGPAAQGAHTTNERVALDELARVAAVYALTASIFCRSA